MKMRTMKTRALLRAIGVTGAVMIVVAGVTFAALQSQAAVLRGNTIQTAVASLKLSSNGTQYGSQLDGFTFGNLIPGGQANPMNGYPVKIKNDGTTALAVSLSVSKPIANPDNVDLSKVHVILTPTAGGSELNTTLKALQDSAASGGVLVNQAERVLNEQVISYLMRISMDSDALNGPTTTLSDIDFSFNARTVN